MSIATVTKSSPVGVTPAPIAAARPHEPSGGLGPDSLRLSAQVVGGTVGAAGGLLAGASGAGFLGLMASAVRFPLAPLVMVGALVGTAAGGTSLGVLAGKAVDFMRGEYRPSSAELMGGLAGGGLGAVAGAAGGIFGAWALAAASFGMGPLVSSAVFATVVGACTLALGAAGGMAGAGLAKWWSGR